jgi:glucuronate isomerase
MWLNWVLTTVFGLTQALSTATADETFDAINEQLAGEDFLPRALFERFNIEVLTTTESPLDAL